MARPVVKRSLIVKAAIGLFANKGLARTTTRDIAQAAGVAEGTLYRHWTSKDDMAWDLYCDRLDAFLDSLRPSLFEDTRLFADRLCEMVDSIYEYYRDNGDEFTFILLTGRGFPQQRYPRQSPFELLAEAIEAEIDANRLSKCDATTLSAMMLGAVLQPVLHHRWGYSKVQPVDCSSEVAAGCVQLMLAFAHESSTKRSVL